MTTIVGKQHQISVTKTADRYLFEFSFDRSDPSFMGVKKSEVIINPDIYSVEEFVYVALNSALDCTLTPDFLIVKYLKLLHLEDS